MVLCSDKRQKKTPRLLKRVSADGGFFSSFGNFCFFAHRERNSREKGRNGERLCTRVMNWNLPDVS